MAVRRSEVTGRAADQTFTLHTREGDIVIALFEEGLRSTIVTYPPTGPAVRKRIWTRRADSALRRTIDQAKAA